MVIEYEYSSYNYFIHVLQALTNIYSIYYWLKKAFLAGC